MVKISRSVQILVFIHLSCIAYSLHRPLQVDDDNVSYLDGTNFTSKIAQDIFPAGIELLRHFRGKISLIVEPKQIYMDAASKMVTELDSMHKLHSWTTLQLYNYTYPNDFLVVQSTVLAALRYADVVVLLMDVRMAKECLIAAHGVLSDTRNRVFVLFQINLVEALGYKREPYRWSTTDFIALTTHTSSLNRLISRNRKLCAMWESVYVVMVTLPSHPMVTPPFSQIHDISIGEVDSHGRESIPASLSTVGTHHVFIRRSLPTSGSGKEGLFVFYPLAVYRYGSIENNASRRCMKMLNKQLHRNQRYSFPQMRIVAQFHLSNHESKIIYGSDWKLRLLTNETFDSPEVAICIFPGGGGSGGTFRLIESIFVISGFVLLVLVSIVVYQELTKTRIEQDFLKGTLMGTTSLTITESKTPVQV